LGKYFFWNFFFFVTVEKFGVFGGKWERERRGIWGLIFFFLGGGVGGGAGGLKVKCYAVE